FHIVATVATNRGSPRRALRELPRVIDDTGADSILIAGPLADRDFAFVADTALASGCRLLAAPRTARVAGVGARSVWGEDMSLVGPRPIVADELDHYGGTAALLLSRKPGLTSNWAINGRSDVSYPQRADLELAYLRQWSLRNDVRIMLRTVQAVALKRGAYCFPVTIAHLVLLVLCLVLGIWAAYMI